MNEAVLRQRMKKDAGIKGGVGSNLRKNGMQKMNETKQGSTHLPCTCTERTLLHRWSSHAPFAIRST